MLVYKGLQNAYHNALLLYMKRVVDNEHFLFVSINIKKVNI